MKIVLGNTKQYKAIVVVDPMQWANHTPIFDLGVTWESLKMYPVNRLTSDGGSIMVYITPPDQVSNALTLIKEWVYHFRTQIIIRMENGQLMVGLVCTNGGVDAPTFGKSPLDPVPIRTVYKTLEEAVKPCLEALADEPIKIVRGKVQETGMGAVLFANPHIRGWDWWDVDNVYSIVGLWDYPFRPQGFLIDQEIVRIAHEIKNLLIQQNEIPWKIGSLLLKADKQNIHLSHLEKAINLKELAPTYRWLWEILQVRKHFPEPVVDTTLSWSEYRNRYKDDKQAKKSDSTEDEDIGEK